jgi:hypothetical protein
VSAFCTAYAEAVAADKLRGRLYSLEYRWNTRFRLWEQPHDADGRALDPALEARTTRLMERQRAARAAEEEASWHLDKIWDRYSRDLPPAAILTDADAFVSDTDRDDAADLLDALITRARAGGDHSTDPYAYGYTRETHDARLLIDLAILRRLPWL